jgi:hypothetical protein
VAAGLAIVTATCGLGLLGGLGLAGASTASTVTQAKKSLLKQSDMPKGWTSAKDTGNSNSSFPGAAQLAACLGVPVSVVNSHPPTAFSPNFSSKNQEYSVQDNVSIYHTAKEAAADFATLSSRKAPPCLTADLNGTGKHAFDAGFGAGATVGTAQVSRSPAADFAPHTTNITMYLPVTDGETTLNVQLTIVDYVRGNKEQTVSLTSIDAQFPVSLSKRLTRTAVGRV